jgi:hypothetical protein
MTYVDMTPAELLARRAAVKAANAEALADDDYARAEQAAASRARSAAFRPTDATTDREKAQQAPVPTETTPVNASDYQDNVPGFELASGAGVYLPKSKFSGEAPRYSKDAYETRKALDPDAIPARVFHFAGPHDTACLGSPVPSKGKEKGTGGEGSFLPRGIMREQYGNVGGEAIEAISHARKLHRKAKRTGPAIVRRTVPLYRQALIARGKPCYRSRNDRTLVHPVTLAPLKPRNGGSLSRDGEHFRARCVPTRSAHSAHVPSLKQAVSADQAHRKARRDVGGAGQ